MGGGGEKCSRLTASTSKFCVLTAEQATTVAETRQPFKLILGGIVADELIDIFK